MVSIGKADWFHKTQGIMPQQQPLNGVKFGGGNSGNGTLIDRLDAIDRGQPSVSAGASYGNVNGDMSLLARLDAIGDRELHPRTDREYDRFA